MKNYEEIYNPYIKPYHDLNSKIQKLIIVNKGITADLEFLKLNNLEDLKNNLETLIKKKEIKQKEVKELKGKSSKMLQELKVLDEKIKSRFNPMYYFSNDQKDLKLQRETLNLSHGKFYLVLTSAMKSKAKLKVKIHNLQNDLKLYKTLDIHFLKTEYDKNNKYIQRATQELKPILSKRNKLARKLKPITDELSKIDREIKKVNSITAKANYYDERLSNARDSRGRAIIHQECERELGNGKPQLIIRQNNELLKKLQRALDKLLERAEKASAKSTREIDAVIIDGNNMAYENNNFIGLKALIPTTARLKEDYDVIVIFDSEIRSMLKMSSQSISDEFDDSIKVHIVASKEKADETILELASVELNAYVISNDRFSDYFDKEVVKSKRVLRHEIVGNSVFIHDLDFKTTF